MLIPALPIPFLLNGKSKKSIDEKMEEAIAEIALASTSFRQFLQYCDQCAYTDRMIETIIDNAMLLKELYETQ